MCLERHHERYTKDKQANANDPQIELVSVEAFSLANRGKNGADNHCCDNGSYSRRDAKPRRVSEFPTKLL